MRENNKRKNNYLLTGDFKNILSRETTSETTNISNNTDIIAMLADSNSTIYLNQHKLAVRCRAKKRQRKTRSRGRNKFNLKHGNCYQNTKFM
jgi:hypothetical protein